MENRKHYADLNIQFRAVPYGQHGDHKVIEYRAEPSTYYKEFSLFNGLIHFHIKRHSRKRWTQPQIFRYFDGNEIYHESDFLNYAPLWVYNQKDLDWYKEKFKTIGEFLEWCSERESKEYEKYKYHRDSYLNRKHEILY